MKVLRPLLAFGFGVLLAVSGCAVDADDDEGDVDQCVTTCEDEHEECSIDCDDDECTASCDEDLEVCETECE
jgi:hypothetical protein